MIVNQVYSSVGDDRAHILVQDFAVNYGPLDVGYPKFRDASSVFGLLYKALNHSFSAPYAVMHLSRILQWQSDILYRTSENFCEIIYYAEN